LLKLLLVVLPLGLDTFAVSAALGVAGLSPSRRLRTSAVMTAFEVAMPIVGLVIGLGAGRVLGSAAGDLALAALAAVGIYILVSRDEPSSGKLVSAGGIALLGLGLGVSLDELAIGFSIGLLGVPAGLAVTMIGIQAFAVSQLGLRLGARVGERVREGAERLAGVALIALALGLLVLRLAGNPG
jgi:putative Mn2+ efflux pump MntP